MADRFRVAGLCAVFLIVGLWIGLALNGRWPWAGAMVGLFSLFALVAVYRGYEPSLPTVEVKAVYRDEPDA